MTSIVGMRGDTLLCTDCAVAVLVPGSLLEFGEADMVVREGDGKISVRYGSRVLG